MSIWWTLGMSQSMMVPANAASTDSAQAIRSLPKESPAIPSRNRIPILHVKNTPVFASWGFVALAARTDLDGDLGGSRSKVGRWRSAIFL